MLQIYHILLRQSTLKYEIRKLTIKYENTEKKATISWSCMIQSRSRGLGLFTITCLGYMHSAGRVKYPHKCEVNCIGFSTCTWSYIKVYRNCIHMTNMSRCTVNNFVGWYCVYQWKIRWVRRVQNPCCKFSTWPYFIMLWILLPKYDFCWLL